MDHQGLPGIEELFREHERLAKKLSAEELTAVRRYVQRTVHAQCQSVVARMRFLQAASDVNESQFQHALVTLQKDLEREQSVAGEFRRELGSLARVFQARELRYQDRHDTLVKEVRKARDTAKQAVTAREEAEAEVTERKKEVDAQKDLVVDLEDTLRAHRDCQQLRDDVIRLGKELLRAKLDVDKLRTELGQATAKLQRGGRTLPLTTTAAARLAKTNLKSGSGGGGGGGGGSNPNPNHVRFDPSSPENIPSSTGGVFTPGAPLPKVLAPILNTPLTIFSNNPSKINNPLTSLNPAVLPPKNKPLSSFNPSVPPTKNNPLTSFNPSVLPAPKNSPVTFTPVTPYCTESACRARQDLEECRAQLIAKCQEVVYLRCALDDHKTARHHQHAFPIITTTADTNSTISVTTNITSRASKLGKPSAAVQPWKTIKGQHKGK